MNPLLWYFKKYCDNCKEKTCQTSGGGVYTANWNAKLMCVEAANVMLELDRPTIRKMRKS